MRTGSTVAPRPVRPVLIVNPRSGGGKAARHDLVGVCGRLGIETVVLGSGDDVVELASAALRAGADAIGVAGGDGSQGLVAAIAAAHDVPYVCVPAGTRNHFALDLGVDRHDVVGALDAFLDGAERHIDLARVNDRVFVNNASMGLYGALVQSSEYRDAKLRTAINLLPDLLGPDAARFDLRFRGRDGAEHRTAQVLLVSNNRYVLDPVPGRGARGEIDTGTLGVVAVGLGPPGPGWSQEWTSGRFRVDSDDRVHLGIDGEAVMMDPPLQFESMPGALRVRVARRG